MSEEKERLYNLLKETFLLLDDGDRRLFDRFQLTAPRFYALLHIGEEPGISSSHLSERMLCDKSNVTRIVRGLEAEGYVGRRPHESDGRSWRLYLTKQGTAVCDKVQSAHQAYTAARLSGIDEIRRGSLIDNLSQLNQLLQAALSTSSPK